MPLFDDIVEILRPVKLPTIEELYPEGKMLERAELGVDGNAGFALLGENLQEGEAEFVEIDLPVSASKDPKRYHNAEWCSAAKRATTKAYRALKARLPGREFSYYLGESHPDHLP